uniref:Uncharacterized protein n=1 Tax=Glossina morsitans morsitans TaxID=37546 RepID=A0A1B0G7N3_GLOMM
MRDNSKEEEYSSTHSIMAMPKHISFPEFANSSELLNESMMFLFTTCAAAMQFINIYRTNWWLPHSNINNTLNFYYIEPFLIILIVAMNSRRLIYCLSMRALDLLLPTNYHRLWRICKFLIEDIILAMLVFCIVMMYNNQNNLSIFLLIYLFVVYYLIFGLKIEPFLRFICEIRGAYFNALPLHCCTVQPQAIRDEIELLRNDFNNRLKQVIFTSVFNAYYAGFLPCFFATAIHYNVWWCMQHIIFVWLSVLTMSIVFAFPSKYSDILHRAALHLGCWSKLELRPGADCVVSAAAANWNKSTLWPHNTVTKCAGELYRCQGPVTVAFPSNSGHLRFYKLFHNPASIYAILTVMQACIIVAGISLLCYAIEWNFILSLSFITLTNQFTFFKLMRDYLITKRIYQTECAINIDKFTD